MLTINHLERHFNILSGQGRFFCILHTENEIRDYKSLKSPFFLQNITKQYLVLPAPFTIHGIVGTHHRVSPRFSNGGFESGKIILPEPAFADIGRPGMTVVFTVVCHVMFHGSNGLQVFLIIPLETLHKSNSHSRQQIRIRISGFPSGPCRAIWETVGGVRFGTKKQRS